MYSCIIFSISRIELHCCNKTNNWCNTPKVKVCHALNYHVKLLTLLGGQLILTPAISQNAPNDDYNRGYSFYFLLLKLIRMGS